MHLYVIREQTNISTKWAKWHFTFSLFWCIYFQLKIRLSFQCSNEKSKTERKSIFKIIKWNWNKLCWCLCRVVLCIGFVNPDSLLAKIQISVYMLNSIQLNAVTFHLNSYFEMLEWANRIPPTIHNDFYY